MPFSDTPPSYDDATRREAWTIIAPWIPSSDLCSACLVSRKWHGIFVPFLWGDPASHFGIANDAVYVALTRFKRTLRRARIVVRSLTHTLHLPPALSEIYGGPSATWLREVLEFLPNLQSLIVSRLPFFDHHSLLALKSSGTTRRSISDPTDHSNASTYGLKLLLAANEPNTTSAGLAVALPRFSRLVYLDLSHTTAARDGMVLAGLSQLYDLQALKLRGVGLRDSEAEVLAKVIGIRVRLLDLGDNLLTDTAVRSLMDACFVSPSNRISDISHFRSALAEDWPAGMAPGPDFFSLDMLRSEDLDHELLKQLTNPLTGRLAFEDLPHRGLTHLYIANNRLSVEGLSSLLKSERLFLLDGGSVDNTKILERTASLTSPTGYIDRVSFPGAEKLIPVLAESARKNLTYLRIDHAVVTAKLEESRVKSASRKAGAEIVISKQRVAELPPETRHIVEAPAPAHYAVELPAAQDPVYELDATPSQPRAELVGDLMYFALSPPIGEKPGQDETASTLSQPIVADGAFAPEPVIIPDDYLTDTRADTASIVNATGPGSTTKRTNGITNLARSSSILATPASAYAPRNILTSDDPALLTTAETETTTAATIATTPTATTIAPINQAAVPRPLPVSRISQREAKIDVLMRKRPASLRLSKSKTDQMVNIADSSSDNLSYLHPSVLPQLRTLVLTNVPNKIPKGSPILDSLKEFISACADEAMLSLLLAKRDYSLPPGRARHLAEVKQARSLFALRTIVLEMAQPKTLSSPLSSNRAWHHSGQRENMSKSSTGDIDSENLWTAAVDDFSFFGEEGEEKDECGIYEHDPEKYFPTAHLNDKIVVVSNGNSDNTHLVSPVTPSRTNGSIRGYQTMTPVSPLATSTTMLSSPRNLPLGRNRRSSNEARRNSGGASAELSSGTYIDPHHHHNQHPPPRFVAPVSGISTTISHPSSTTANQSNQLSLETKDQEQIDLIAELASWRKARKKAYEEEVLRIQVLRKRRSLSNDQGLGLDHGLSGNGVVLTSTEIEDMPIVQGHWKGDVKVVRNSSPRGRSGVVDMYGNYFEKGYLYP